MDNDLNRLPAPRVYTLRPGRRLSTVLFGMFFTLVGPTFLWVVLHEDSGPAAPDGIAPAVLLVFVFSITTLLGILLLATALRTRLVTSAEGIEHRQALSTVRVPWSKVLRIGDIPVNRHGRTVEGLFLAEPSTPSNRSLLWWVGSVEFRDKIPLKQFDRNWRDGPLGDDLRRYAPHLFEEGDWPDP